MVMICLVSAKNAPGVTTTTVALAEIWPRPVLVAECDPRYGDILAGYQQGTGDMTKGLLGLAAIHQRSDITQQIYNFVQPLSPGSEARLLAGIQVPAQAPGVAGLWEPLSHLLPSMIVKRRPVDVLVDCGSLHSPYAPLALIRNADLVLLLTGDHLEHIRAAHDAVQTLTAVLTAARHRRGAARRARGRRAPGASPPARQLPALGIHEGRQGSASLHRPATEPARAGRAHRPPAAARRIRGGGPCRLTVVPNVKTSAPSAVRAPEATGSPAACAPAGTTPGAARKVPACATPSRS